MAAGSHVIETTSLTKHYGSIVAVDGLSMSVPRGHVFGLLGPNGSGKTTTMSMLLGLVRPTVRWLQSLRFFRRTRGGPAPRRRDY